MFLLFQGTPEVAAESPDVSMSPTEVPDVSASLDKWAESPELSKGPEPASGSTYGPIRRVHGKAGPKNAASTTSNETG